MGEKYPALRYSNNMGGNFKKGVWSIECYSWREFEGRIEELKRHNYKYVWRGQSSVKPLLPNIFRDNTPCREKIEKHFNQFRKDIPGAGALEQFLKLAKKSEWRSSKKH